MSVSKVHSCKEQIKVAEGRLEPPSGKCRCKKYIGIKKATEMVKNGEASFIVLLRVREGTDEICHLCLGNKEVKNCANCFGKGAERGTIVREDYGNDIVLVSRPPVDKKEKKRSSVLSMKTPRVATIESEHIELAYVLNVKEARERIEEYGRLVQIGLQELGAELRKPKNFLRPSETTRIVIPGTREPEDDQKKGQGRRFDYGRAI